MGIPTSSASEQELRGLVERLSATLSSLDELVFVLDLDGRFVDYHAPADQPLLLAPSSFLGRPFREVLPPELAGPLEGRLAQVLAEGNVLVHEYHMTLGGRDTWWRARISPRRDERGAIAGFTISSREVTARKLAESQVQELNARLVRRVEALTGPVKDTETPQLGDLFDLEEIQRIQDAFAIATGVGSLIVAPDGTPITRPSNFCRLCEHIIRGTEKGLCNCRRSDVLIGRYHPEGPVIQPCLSGGLWDAGTTLNAGDRHIASWLIGQVRNEVIDESAILNYAAEIGADPAEFMKALGEVTRMPRVQFERICQALHLIGNQLSQLALRNLQQARFITELQRLEDQLRQSQKMEAIGQLAGGVAHDFNNILTAQYMHLALLQERTDLPADVQESIAAMQTGARMAADLTRQLLAFGRRQVFQVQRLELNELLANLLKLFRRVLGEHIEVRIVPAPAALFVQGDAGMIEQVVINLAVNARDAMPQGGMLRLVCEEVRFPENARLAHPDARPGSYARIAVIDTGCGMPTETLQHIFEPFFTTKARGAGTGLGLATVYGIVRQHQGWVEVESSPGEGSTFKVYLPLVAEPSAPRSAQTALAGTGAGAGQLILVVEDDDDVRRMLAAILKRLGYRVVEAASGVEALVLWEKHRTEIRLVFTDTVMPGGIDGRELVARLLAEAPDLHVVLASGYSLDLARLGLPEGHCTFLAKPYDKKRVAEIVSASLQQVACA
jgi:PAS domain S-box-containing protein